MSVINVNTRGHSKHAAGSSGGLQMKCSPLSAQLIELQKCFPSFDWAPALSLAPLRESEAEFSKKGNGLVLMPSPWSLAPPGECEISAYTHSARLVYRQLRIARERNFRVHPLAEQNIGNVTLLPRTAAAWKRLRARYTSGPVVMPVQFGLQHQRCDFCEVRDTFESSEFFLGPYEIAIILLTHRSLLARAGSAINCGGLISALPPEAGSVPLALSFSANYDGLRLSALRHESVNRAFGWATGWVA